MSSPMVRLAVAEGGVIYLNMNTAQLIVGVIIAAIAFTTLVLKIVEVSRKL
jgi:hypothetical protein